MSTPPPFFFVEKTEKLKVDGDFGNSGKNRLKWEVFGRNTEGKEVIWKDSIFADDL